MESAVPSVSSRRMRGLPLYTVPFTASRRQSGDHVAIFPLELPPNTSRHANTSCVCSSSVLLKIGAGNFSYI
jgi:hypothetical protein